MSKISGPSAGPEDPSAEPSFATVSFKETFKEALKMVTPRLRRTSLEMMLGGIIVNHPQMALWTTRKKALFRADELVIVV